MFPEAAPIDWDAEPLRRALVAAGYTAKNFRPADPDGRTLQAKEARPLLALALDLFGHGKSLPETAAAELLGQALEPLVEIGLLSRDAGGLRSVIRIDPDGDHGFASDHPSRLADRPADFTMGIGRSTRLLAALAPVRGHRGDTALDLCTGAAWVALRLAAAGCQVTATDLNPRALAFARLNARLADRPGIEFLQGSALEPVRDRRFDLITANPPFVISPESSLAFRDSGQPGCSFCESLARALPDHLNPDGIAVMLLSWFDDGGDARATVPLAWLEGSGCGRWLFRTVTQSPDEYARLWLADTAGRREPVDRADLQRWTNHFRELGATRLHTGFLVVHRTRGREWVRSDVRSTDRILTSAGDDIRRVVEGEAWLARHQPDPETLLRSSFEVPAGLRAESVSSLDEPGGWKSISIRLLSPGRLAYDGAVDGHLLSLLAHCRDGRPPATVLSEIGTAPHLPPPEVIRERSAGLVRELVRHGLLIPAGPS